MTGLDKQRDALVEIAVLVTDADLNILGDGVDVVIRPPAEALQGMDPFVVNMHTVSGLLEELDGGMTLAEAEALSLHSDAHPLVLLDDVLSELDEDRRRTLGEIVAAGGQTVVTTTSAVSLPTEPAQHLAVVPGEVRAV